MATSQVHCEQPTSSDCDKSEELKLYEAHYFSLPSQGNVYTMCDLTDENGVTKLLVACLQRKVFSIDYINCKPCMREIPFTSLPSDVEIVSVGACRRPEQTEEFIVGMSIIKKSDNNNTDVSSQFLHFYTWDLSCDTILSCLSSTTLDYIPYHLYHTTTMPSKSNEAQTIWLLSGGDSEIHMFAWQEKEQYEAIPISEYFPELSDLSGIVLKISILYADDNRSRTTAICQEDGSVTIFNVEQEEGVPKVIKSRVLTWDYPTSSISLYYKPKVDDIIKSIVGKEGNFSNKTDWKTDVPYLVVSNSLEGCVAYRDPVKGGEGFELPHSITDDAVTCCFVCDIDNDLHPEILIGSYSGVVNIYKSSNITGEWIWSLLHVIPVPFPVLAINFIDIIGDGTRQLIIVTTAGVHIFKHDPWILAKVLSSRMKLFAASIKEN